MSLKADTAVVEIDTDRSGEREKMDMFGHLRGRHAPQRLDQISAHPRQHRPSRASSCDDAFSHFRLSSALWVAAVVIAAPWVLGAQIQGTAASHSARGDRTVVLRADGGATHVAMGGAQGFFPGKSVERILTLSTPSGTEFEAVTLTTEAGVTSLLDSDPVDGLQLSIDACSVPWQSEGIGESASFSCRGAVTLVLARRAVIGTAIPLNGLSVTKPGGVDYLRLTLLLPVSADNRFQGQSSRITHSFQGTSRQQAAERQAQPLSRQR